MKDTDIVQADTAVKKRGRGGKYNFPNAVEPEDPETVRAALGSVLYWMNRGRENKPVTDDEIEARCLEYCSECYQTGQRMTVEKLALALGITRETLHQWETGGVGANARRTDIIKKTKDVISSYDAEMVTSGKMNPVPYIFRAKNYYGMKDQTDITIEPRQGITDQDAETVAAKYAELPQD